jgi:hypothetical protein
MIARSNHVAENWMLFKWQGKAVAKELAEANSNCV